jgi:FkbM family methyltransferase
VSEIFAHYVKEGSVVLDIGANIGAMTVPLAKLCGVTGAVHAFEPLRVLSNM